MLKEITDIKTFVGLVEGENQGPTLEDRIDVLEHVVGEEANGKEPATGLFKDVNELKDFVGLGEMQGDQPNLLDRLDDLEELVGNNAEEGEEARGGIVKDITNIKRMIGYVDGNTYTVPLLEQIKGLQNLVGTPAKGEDPATGLHREIKNLQESIEEVKDDYLKFWVGTNAEYQALTKVEHGRLYIIID